MQKAKVKGDSKQLRPALTPEANESQMISLAMDLAKRQLQEGTASSQVITHFLKLATSKAELERVKLERETELLRAKTDAIESSKDMLELYDNAIKAMQRYSGNGVSEEDDY